MSRSFNATAWEMGYNPFKCNSEEYTAVKNQMKRDREGEALKGNMHQQQDPIRCCEHFPKCQHIPPADRKDTAGKPDPLLIPYEAVVAYSKVSDYGQEKYGNRDSWKNSTRGVPVYSSAAARHLFKSINEVHDTESGLPHLYHALWSVAAAIWHLENKK